MNFFLILILKALMCVPIIKTSNILVFTPSPWKSHIVSFHPLFLELAQRGHNITVLTKFAVKNPPLNYTQVIINYDMDFDSITKDLLQGSNKYLFLIMEFFLRNVISVGITETYISTADVQKFIKNDESKFDLVIVESFFQECTIAMGHKYGAPVISLIPVAPWVTPSHYAANPIDSTYIKDYTLDSGKILDFKGRLINTLFGLYGLYIEPFTYLPRMESLMNKYFQYPGYENRPCITEMLKNISLSLIDSDVGILSSRPYVPSFVEVPGISLRPMKKIKKNLQSFMDNAKMGIVYLNFGTILNLASLPKPTIMVLINVLGRLEQKVIFKWNNNDTKEFPDNFYVDSWLPQHEILKHPNCKLFITHGGFHGLIETIDAGIPFIGFPIFGDQYQNLRTSQENGLGIMSNFFTLSEETFEKDVNLILTDNKFTENAKKMSAVFKDRQMTTIDKAVYWVEYVVRYKGAYHLRSASVELLWYQYYAFDIIAFFIFIILIFIFICSIIFKCILKLIINFISKTKKIKIL